MGLEKPCYRNLDDKHVEGNADDEAWLVKLVLNYDSVLWLAVAEELATINTRPAPLA